MLLFLDDCISVTLLQKNKGGGLLLYESTENPCKSGDLLFGIKRRALLKSSVVTV